MTAFPSPADIERAKTPKGGWTKAQLAEWGVSWPPPKGWRDALTAAWWDRHHPVLQKDLVQGSTLPLEEAAEPIPDRPGKTVMLHFRGAGRYALEVELDTAPEIELLARLGSQSDPLQVIRAGLAALEALGLPPKSHDLTSCGSVWP